MKLIKHLFLRTVLFCPLLLADDAFAEGGETCVSATVITCLPYTDTGNTSDNISDYDGQCTSGGIPADVVYRYTPPVTQQVTWSVCNTNFNSAVYIFDGNCSGTPAYCDVDGGCGNPNATAWSEEQCVTMSPHHDYYIVVDGDFAQFVPYEGAYTLTATLCSGCPVIQTVSISQEDTLILTGNTCGQLDCCTPPANDQRQVIGLNAAAGTYTFSLCDPDNPAAWNSRLLLAYDCCGNSLETSDDDYCALNGLSRIWRTLGPGTYYLIIEGATASDCGNWTLRINAAEPTGCTPDDTLYVPGSISGNTCLSEQNCEYSVSRDELIYVVIPESGYYAVSLCSSPATWNSAFKGTSTDYYDCCTNLTYIFRDGCPENDHPYAVNYLEQNFLLVIHKEAGAYGPVCGPWTLTAYPVDPPCSNVDTLWSLPGSMTGNTCLAENTCWQQSGSLDQSVVVRLPLSGHYQFSLCRTDTVWQAGLTLQASCCGQILPPQSIYTCASGMAQIRSGLMVAGFVFVKIEDPMSPFACGPWTLDVFYVDTLPAPDSLVIRAVGPDIRLDWPAVVMAGEYWVFRAATPDVSPIPPNYIGTAVNTAFIDANVLNSGSLTNFYAVTAVTDTVP